MSLEEYVISTRNKMRKKYKDFEALEPAMSRLAWSIPCDHVLWEGEVDTIFRALYEVSLKIDGWWRTKCL